MIETLKTCKKDPGHVWVADIPFCPYCNISQEARVFYGEQDRKEIKVNDIILQKIDGARLMLLEATTIQSTKRVIDIAVSAEVFAKRQKMSEEAIQYATDLKMEALRQLGNMLKETPKQTAEFRKGGGSKGSRKELILSAPPTLAELGLDKKTSSLAQKIAELPEEQFEAVKRGVALKKAEKEVVNMRKFEKNTELVKLAEKVKPSDRWSVFASDIHNVELEPNSIDAIITDPPYPQDCLPLWAELGKFAKRHLKEGGVLLAMTGNLYLPQILEMLGEHLTYQWQLACELPGQHSEVHAAWVNNQMWKPVLVYRNGGKLVNIGSDLFRNEGRDKEFHEWGQGIGGYLWQIEHFTKPNDLICDPFLGGGTTAIASLKLKRRFVGFDVDPEKVAISKGRISKELD